MNHQSSFFVPILVSVLSFIGFLFLLHFTLSDYPIIHLLNLQVADFFRSIQTENITIATLLFTSLTNLNAVVPVLILLCIYLLHENKHLEAAYLFLGLLLMWCIVFILKSIFNIERPENAIVFLHDTSFPSGHATLSFSSAFLMYLFFGRQISSTKWKTFCIIILSTLVLLTGLSRVYLGVHRFNEVLAGFLLAGSCMPLIYISYLYDKRIKQSKEDLHETI
jgi:undecaprenyl-diphosphatase